MFLTGDPGSCRDDECFISLLRQMTKITMLNMVSPTNITTTAIPTPIAIKVLLLSSDCDFPIEETV